MKYNQIIGIKIILFLLLSFKTVLAGLDRKIFSQDDISQLSHNIEETIVSDWITSPKWNAIILRRQYKIYTEDREETLNDYVSRFWLNSSKKLKDKLKNGLSKIHQEDSLMSLRLLVFKTDNHNIFHCKIAILIYNQKDSNYLLVKEGKETIYIAYKQAIIIPPRSNDIRPLVPPRHRNLTDSPTGIEADENLYSTLPVKIEPKSSKRLKFSEKEIGDIKSSMQIEMRSHLDGLEDTYRMKVLNKRIKEKKSNTHFDQLSLDLSEEEIDALLNWSNFNEELSNFIRHNNTGYEYMQVFKREIYAKLIKLYNDFKGRRDNNSPVGGEEDLIKFEDLSLKTKPYIMPRHGISKEKEDETWRMETWRDLRTKLDDIEGTYLTTRKTLCKKGLENVSGRSERKEYQKVFDSKAKNIDLIQFYEDNLLDIDRDTYSEDLRNFLEGLIKDNTTYKPMIDKLKSKLEILFNKIREEQDREDLTVEYELDALKRGVDLMIFKSEDERCTSRCSWWRKTLNKS